MEYGWVVLFGWTNENYFLLISLINGVNSKDEKNPVELTLLFTPGFYSVTRKTDKHRH